MDVDSYYGLISALIRTYWLEEHESEDRRQVEAALSAALSDFAKWGEKV